MTVVSLLGAFVGATVGLDDGAVVPPMATLRTLLLKLSAMYTLLPLPSTEMYDGE
jgi:hypothetical protein